MNAAAPIISGSLSDLDLDKVMEVTSLGRQQLRLEVESPTGIPIGHVVLKAGRIVSASAGSLKGEAALRTVMAAEQNAHFRLLREKQPLPATAPLGLIGERTDLVSKGPATPAALPPSADRVQIMQGSLAEFDALTLLSTLSISRQYTELDIKGNGGDSAGRLVLKSGKVVFAQFGGSQGTGAIRALLASPSTAQFVVSRLGGTIHTEMTRTNPVGDLGQILLSLQPPAPANQNAEAPRSQVMEGLLSEFDVPTLLQTVGAGRQNNVLEIFDNGRLIGSLQTKAGMLLAASSPGKNGITALLTLVRAPAHCKFKVFRLAGETPVGEPIGPIGNLLMDMMDSDLPVAAPEAHEAEALTAPVNLSLQMKKPSRTSLWLGGAAVGLVLAGGIGLALRGSDSAPPAVTATSPAEPPSAVAPPAVAPQVVAPAAPAAVEPVPIAAIEPVAAPPVAETKAAETTAQPTAPAEKQRPVARQKVLSVRRAQSLLKGLGYSPGPIDNIFGKRTRAAVVAFQRAEKLPESGNLDSETLGVISERSRAR